MSNSNKMSRRRFLALAGSGLASAGISEHLGALKARASNQSGKLDDVVQNPNKKDRLESKFSFCNFCPNKCGLIARVQNKRVIRLDPNPNHAKSRGMICARGNAGIQQLYDPDRLKYPLLRKGKRGEGKWQRLSWEEALDLAAKKFRDIADKYTRCGWWFTWGADAQAHFVHRFANVFGSYHKANHESLCFWTRNRGFLDVFGEGPPYPDVLNSKYIIMIGANRFESLITPDSIDLMTAIQNGAKLLVLDPRRTKTAARAQEWHPVKPGTDMAFVLALMQVIIKEELYNPEIILKETTGFNDLAEHVRSYTPEWAARETGIPAREIKRIARELAQAAPAAMVYPGRRSSFYTNSTEIWRSFAILNGLLGNFDRPGGLLARQDLSLHEAKSYLAPWYEDNPSERADAHKAPLMFEDGAMLTMRDVVINEDPYPVKGLFAYHTNPMQAMPNRDKTRKMLENMEFVISVDIKMSDTAWMSDLVLPAPSALERRDPASVKQAGSAGACVYSRDPVVPPLFESRPVFEILKDLAKRLDLGKFFDFDLKEYREEQLKGMPEVKKALQEKGVYNHNASLYGLYKDKSLRTSSGKIELSSARYKEKGLNPVPVYKRPQEVPENSFRLVVGRNACYTNSNTQNNWLLLQFVSDNPLWINPRAAKRIGIRDGDEIKVSSSVSQVRTVAKVTQDIREDTVCMWSGFGNISDGLTQVGHKGASVAELLEDHIDTLNANAALHETFVKVKQA